MTVPLLGDILQHNARHFPNRTAIVAGERRVTHREHAARVRQLASGWHDRGLRRQDRVSILAMNCVEFLEVYGAAAFAGTIVNTVNWRLAEPEIAHVLADVAPAAIVFEAQYSDTIAVLRDGPAGGAHLVCLGDPAPDWATPYEALLESGDEAGPPQRATPDDALCIVYTSGDRKSVV